MKTYSQSASGIMVLWNRVAQELRAHDIDIYGQREFKREAWDKYKVHGSDGFDRIDAARIFEWLEY